MRIVEVYSHQHALEYLKVHKRRLWNEINSAIKAVDAHTCKTKKSKEKTKLGRILYSPIEMNKKMAIEFSRRDWSMRKVNYWVTSDAGVIRETMKLEPERQKRVIAMRGHVPIKSSNQTDFVKDKVAVEVQFGKYAFVAFDLFVKHMAFYVSDVIDIGIEILPVKELSEEMSSGVAYYERELYNLVRQGRGIPAVPLVLIGVAP